MKRCFQRFTIAFGILLMCVVVTASANAACGDFKTGAKLHQQSWDFGSVRPASLMLTSGNADPVVGMWHVTFTAQGNESGPPDGTPIDNAMAVWHSDGTEIMNSDRPAQDGNFCLGVWEKTGKLTYKLNHMPWAGNDTANAPAGIGNPSGAVQILEEVTLSPDGKHYAGTFTLDAYDTSGNPVAHIVGIVTATRVTVNTKVKDLL